MPSLSRVTVKQRSETEPSATRQAGFLSTRRIEVRASTHPGYWDAFFDGAEVYHGCLVKQIGRLWWVRDGWTIGTSARYEDAIRAIDIMKG